MDAIETREPIPSDIGVRVVRALGCDVAVLDIEVPMDRHTFTASSAERVGSRSWTREADGCRVHVERTESSVSRVRFVVEVSSRLRPRGTRARYAELVGLFSDP